MIPISIFLIIFLAFMLLVLLFTFFNVYHMLRFGRAGTATIAITGIYVAAVGILIVWSAYLMITADWSSSIDVFGFSPANIPTLLP